MTGREKCRMLKEMCRMYIKSEELDITIPDCDFQGPCAGTCPSCEAELLMIAQLLDIKASQTVNRLSEIRTEDCDSMAYECIVDDKNMEVAVMSCEYNDCIMLNSELEELGLSEYTF